MSIPTVICQDAAFTYGATYPWPETDHIIFQNSGGSSPFKCNPVGSVFATFAPSPEYQTIDNTDFYTLWGGVVAIMVAGFIVKRLLKVFNVD